MSMPVVAEFMPKYGRLASECLEQSEDFLNSLSDWDRYYMTKAAVVVAAAPVFAVVCWSSSEWKSMLVIGIGCFLGYIISLGSLFMRTIYITPKGTNFGDPGFQLRWKSLLIKFRASCHWWSLPLLAMNCLNLRLDIPGLDLLGAARLSAASVW